MNRKSLMIGLALSCMLILGSVTAYAAPISTGAPSATLLVSGLQGGSGSTIGPDGALYVTEAAAGRVSRVDPKTGNVTTFAERPAEIDHRPGRSDGHRVHRPDRVCARHARWFPMWVAAMLSASTG